MDTTTNEYDCCICMTTKPYPIHLVCCKQLICMDCIKKWIETSRMCPMCRTNLPTSIYPNEIPNTRTTRTTRRSHRC